MVAEPFSRPGVSAVVVALDWLDPLKPASPIHRDIKRYALAESDGRSMTSRVVRVGAMCDKDQDPKHLVYLVDDCWTANLQNPVQRRGWRL